MGAFSKAFYDRLAGDATLVAQLGVYGGQPSIFTKRPLPVDFKFEEHGPYILTTGQVLDLPGDIDTKNSPGRDITRDVRCYGSTDDSPTVIESIAERARTLFQRYNLPVDGFTVQIAETAGPTEADEDDVFGRVVTVRLRMETN